jgi:hypothetical protein
MQGAGIEMQKGGSMIHPLTIVMNGLFECRVHMTQIEWGDLVDVIV